jgi:hypothetical protein
MSNCTGRGGVCGGRRSPGNDRSCSRHSGIHNPDFLFVVQSQAASEQRVRSEQTNTQTRALLAEVRATAQATQGMVSLQFSQLLQAFVTGAAQTAEETKFDPVSFEQRLLSNIRTAVQPSAISGQPRVRATGVGSVQSAGEGAVAQPRVLREQSAIRRRARNVRLDHLKTFPSEEEGSAAANAVRELSQEERHRLQALGEDEVTATERGWFVGLEPNSTDKTLEEKYLVGPVRIHPGDGPKVITRLTDDGVRLARLFTALGDIPIWARELIEDQDRDATGMLSDDDIPF